MTTTSGQQVVKLVKTGLASGIFIECEKVEEVITNELIKIPRPITKSNQDTLNYGSMILDLKMIDHSFEIQGFLSASKGSGNEGFGDSYTARNHLIRYIIGGSEDVQLHYRQYNDYDLGPYYGNRDSGTSTTYINVSIDKVSFTDASLRADSKTGLVERYRVVMSLTRGKLK